jgi:hypothetical protein
MLSKGDGVPDLYAHPYSYVHFFYVIFSYALFLMWHDMN